MFRLACKRAECCWPLPASCCLWLAAEADVSAYPSMRGVSAISFSARLMFVSSALAVEQTPATSAKNTAAIISGDGYLLLFFLWCPKPLPVQTRAGDSEPSEERSFYLGWSPRLSPSSGRRLQIIGQSLSGVSLTTTAHLFSLLLSL